METTIQVHRGLKDKLEKLKIHPRESYEKVIERLISSKIDQEPLSAEEIKDIEKSLKDIKNGKLYTTKEMSEKLGI